jgi:DNA primase
MASRWFANIDVEDLLTTLGATNITKHGDEYRYSCLLSGHDNGDQNPSARMLTGEEVPQKGGLWQCYGCREKGRAVDLVHLILGLSEAESWAWLINRYGSGGWAHEGDELLDYIKDLFADHDEARERPQPQLDEDAYWRKYGVDWHEALKPSTHVVPELRYLPNRGLNADTLARWKIGYDPRWRRVTIPVHDACGAMVGIKARAIDDGHPKYLVMGDGPGKHRYGFPMFDRNRVLFGLHRVGPKTWAVLCEGELNAIALDQVGIPAVATQGVSFSEEQIDLLRRHLDRVVLMYDPDRAGQDAAIAIADILDPYLDVRVVEGHEMDAMDYLQAGRGDELPGLVSAASPAFLLALQRVLR